MRTFLLLVLCTLWISTQLTGQNPVYYKFRIVDAEDANSIYHATDGENWTHNKDWPLKEGVIFQYGSPYGVSFIRGDTVIMSYPETDTGIVDLSILSLELDYNNLSGTIPSIKMDSLVLLDLSSNNIDGVGDIEAKHLQTLNLSLINLGTLNNLDYPFLERLVAINASISGELGQWNTPNLKYLDLNNNQLTSIAELEYPRLETLYLQGNNIAGTLSRWETPALLTLNLWGNQLTGVTADLDYPMLEHLDLSFNNISGTIPNWELPNLKLLGLSNNNFTGPIPEFNYPLMEQFSVGGNDLTGRIPDFSWPNCQSFNAGGNNLSGELPDFYAPALWSYSLRENKLTGDLQNLDFPNLEALWLDYNQLDGVVASELDLPALTSFRLEGNKLKGEFPVFSMPEMRDFRIAFNEFEGDFPDAEMPNLERLHIQGNKFHNLPDYTGSDGFWNLACAINYLHFDDLIPYKDIERLEAGLMRPVDMYARAVGDSIELTVNVGGEGNQYAWITLGDTVKTGSDTLFIDENENPSNYTCWITNPLVPNTRLSSELVQPPAKRCWSNGIFKLCIDHPDAGWEAGNQDDEITTSYPVSINDFLFFEGSMTLDTSDLELRVNGQLYAKDVPLTGGAAGNFKLAEGEYALSLAGSDGVITGFINDALGAYVPEIGGLKLKVETLKLLGGLNANGVAIAFTVSFNNITPSCGNTTGQTTEIKMEGLAITTEGFSVDGLEVNDFGFAPGFCLKQLVASYNQNEDKLGFGLKMQTPFIEVGGGLGFIAGELDSIAMKAVLQNTIIPIGTTGVGIIGCEGRVSNLTSPPWNMRFGGIFSAVASDDIFQLTTSVEYIPPSVLKLEAGDGKFINPPFYDDWWQIEGGIYGQIDLQSYKMKIGGNVMVAPYLDESDKKFMGTGAIDLAYRNSGGGVFLGTFKGSVTVPELSKRWPFDWMSAKVGLPYTVSSEGLLLRKPVTSYLIGDLDMGGRVGVVQYRIEFDRPYDHPDFFTLLMKDADITRSRAEGFQYEFDIPVEAEMVVIRITGDGVISPTEISLPGGVSIDETQPEANMEVDRLDNASKLFWTIYQPAAGIWMLSVEEEVDLEVKIRTKTAEAFGISAINELDGVRVLWDVAGFSDSDSLELFTDNDTMGMDGAYLLTAYAREGNVFIPDSVLSKECRFYIGAMGFRDNKPVAAYSTEPVTGLNELHPPEGILLSFDEDELRITAEWMPSNAPDVAGYVVHIIDGGVHTPVAMLYSDETHFEYTLDDYHGQRVAFYTYGTDGRVSCASEEFELVITRTDDAYERKEQPLVVFPNPFRDAFVVRFLSEGFQEAQVRVSNLQGEEILSRHQHLIPGINDLAIRLGGRVTSGAYIITVVTDRKVFSEKAIMISD